METPFYFDKIVITLICLSMLYGILLLSIIYQFYKFRDRLKIVYGFYISLLLEVISRFFTFTIMAFFPDLMLTSGIYAPILLLFMVFPDMINYCVYAFLAGLFFNSYIVSHVSLARDINIFYKNSNPILKDRTKVILFVTIPLYVATFITFSLLSGYSIIPEEIITIVNAIFNIVTPLLSLFYYFYLTCKFSGSPYSSEENKNQISKMYLIIIVWSLSRLASGIASLITRNFFIRRMLSSIYDGNPDNIAIIIEFASFCVFTELLPCLLVLSSDLIVSSVENSNLYKKRVLEILINAENSEEIIIDPSQNNNEQMQNEYIINHNDTDINQRLTMDNRVISITQDFIIKENAFSINSQISSYKKGCLGEIHSGVFNEKDVSIRVIEFDRLSRYNLEEISNDIDEILNINHTFLNRVKAICLEKSPKIYLIYSSPKLSSLEDILYSKDKIQLSKKQKVDLSIKICLAIKYLHDNNIPHLHLSNKNILIDKSLNPKVTDFGFKKLKELASIFLKYKNKNSYSSPEILKINSSTTNSLIALIEKSIHQKYLDYINSDIPNGKSSSSPHSTPDRMKLEKSNSLTIKELPFAVPMKDEGFFNRRSINKKDFLENFDTNKIIFSCDIYSLGLIIWEIFTEVRPFSVSLKEIYKYVIEQNLRPEIISEQTPPQIAAIIRKCWNNDFNIRPTIDQLVEALRKVVI